MLPRLIILNATRERYVLLSLSLVERYIEASIVDNSKYLFSTAGWRSDGIEGQPKDYMFKRISSRSKPKIYSSILCKTSNYLIVPWNEPIHVYKMKYSGVILQSKYFKVFEGSDVDEKWHFKKPLPLILPLQLLLPLPLLLPMPLPLPLLLPMSLPLPLLLPLPLPLPLLLPIPLPLPLLLPLPLPLPLLLPLPLTLHENTKVPSHIIRGFVEYAIHTKEVCPISLDALVMGNVAMTKCGHLFEKNALINVINVNTCPTCPTCRAVIRDCDIVII